MGPEPTTKMILGGDMANKIVRSNDVLSDDLKSRFQDE